MDVVGEYVRLKKSGQGYSGICPFHKEKTPSFHVQPQKGFFHCFGCHKGGNIFVFLAAIEGISFPDAVRKLADRTGVVITEKEFRPARPKRIEAALPARELDASTWAAEFFHALLMKSPQYDFARKYLKGRGISKATVEKFKIGVSPKGWATLLLEMKKAGFSATDLQRAGLIIEKAGAPNGGYDRFRERLMFPIRNTQGQVVGFGARLLVDAPEQPKYINSPESTYFTKRSLLYGLFENQRTIRMQGELVIVEGYMDVVGLAEHGVHNAVASMGTALTEDHCQLIKTQTRKVVTVFDPDAAGSEAWHRSVHIALEAGLLARDLSLPDGLDPDEFVAKHGAEAFHKACSEAPRQLTKLLKEIATKGTLGEEERGKLLEKLTPVLIATRNSGDRFVFWDGVGLVLQMSMEALAAHVEHAMKGPRTVAPAKDTPKKTEIPSRPSARPQTTPPPPPLNRLDLEFWEAALRAPAHFMNLKAGWLPHVMEPSIKEWLESMSQAVSPQEFWDIVERRIAHETQPLLLSKATQSAFSKDSAKSPGTEELLGLVSKLEQRTREKEIKALTIAVKMSARTGNEVEQIQLLKKLEGLRSTHRDIPSKS